MSYLELLFNLSYGCHNVTFSFRSTVEQQIRIDQIGI